MFDQLESRRLLAASLGFDGVLRITGDLNKLGHARADRIVLAQSGFQVYVVQNTELLGVFDAGDINQIEIDPGGGNDKVLARDDDGTSPIEIPMVITGGAGNDTLEGGDNGDTVSGGGGNDSVAGGLGGDDIFGGPGNDRLNGSTFAVTSFNGFLDDAGDVLDGGSGRDIADYSTRTVSLFISNDNVPDDGQLDSDLFDGDPATEEFDNVMSTCEDLYGGTGNDAIAGPGANNFAKATGSSNSFIDGGAGNDLLFGELGNDTIYGGKGNDVLCGGTGGDSLEGGPGTDFLLGDYRFIRDSGPNPDFAPLFDFIPTNFAGDTLNGGDGDDFIRGGGDTYFPTQSGNDVINGGLGNDLLFGDDGDDSILGGAGTDLLEGDAGDDSMLAGADDDIILNHALIVGGSDTDFVDGGDGFDIGQGDIRDSQPEPATIEFFLTVDDILSEPSGAPVLPQQIQSGAVAQAKPKVVEIDGTGKADAISITQVGAIVSVSVNGVVTTYTAANVRRFNVEGGKGNDTIMLQTSKGKNATSVPVMVVAAGGNDTIVGGSAGDGLYGGDGDDSISGGGGTDQLFGGPGNDTLLGGEGNDFLNGGDTKIPTGDGADYLFGGPGVDQADYRGRTDNLTITINDDKANDGTTGEKDNVISDIENILSGSGNDNLTGNAASNVLVGNDGNDTLEGGAGNDKLLPEKGNDLVSGSAGLDFYGLGDGKRDEVKEAFSNLVFGFTDFFNGDPQIDYSLASQSFLGLSSSQQPG